MMNVVRGRRVLPAVTAALAAGLVMGVAQASAATQWVHGGKAGVPPGTNCGHPGYERIQDAVDGAAPGDTIIVCGGRYAESVTVDKTVTIEGQGNPTVVPPGEDANEDNSTAAPLQIAFRIAADGVTLRDMRVDGQGNQDLTSGKNNFRFAVASNSSNEALTVENLKIRNIFRRAIQVVGGSGHLIDGNSIDNVEVGYGIIVFETKDTDVTENSIEQAPNGFGSNYLTSAANAPVVNLAGNDIRHVSFGMNASGLGTGSTIGDNSVSVKGGDDGVGIVLQYAAGAVAIDGNRVEGSHRDAGIWLYHNEEDSAVTVERNDIRSAGSADDGVGSATGIFMTDDGDLFGDEDGSSYADVTRNEIRHWVRGVHVYRNGDEPPPGRPVQPNARGFFAENCIAQNREWGMLVSGQNQANGGDVKAEQNWWGAKDGPSGVGPGHGDAVSQFVDFTPWATQSKVCSTK